MIAKYYTRKPQSRDATKFNADLGRQALYLPSSLRRPGSWMQHRTVCVVCRRAILYLNSNLLSFGRSVGSHGANTCSQIQYVSAHYILRLAQQRAGWMRAPQAQCEEDCGRRSAASIVMWATSRPTRRLSITPENSDTSRGIDGMSRRSEVLASWPLRSATSRNHTHNAATGRHEMHYEEKGDGFGEC